MTILSSRRGAGGDINRTVKRLDGAQAKKVFVSLLSPIYRTGKIVNGPIVTSPN